MLKKKIFPIFLVTFAVILSGCQQKNQDDLFTSMELTPPFEYMEMYYYFLNNLPDYLNGNSDEYYVYDETGVRDEYLADKFIELTHDDDSEPHRGLIMTYILNLSIEDLFGDVEGEEGIFYINKLYYLGDKMYLDSTNKTDAEINSESDPRKVVENYFNAIKNGDDTQGYKYPNVFDFYNVVNYTYIDTKKENKFTDYYIINKNDYEQYGFTKDDDIESIKNKLEEKGLSVEISSFDDDGDTIKIDLNREIKEYDLVYDVEVTTKGGEKRLKKYLFNLSTDNPQNVLKIRYKIEIG